jgi:hypothetical protein
MLRRNNGFVKPWRIRKNGSLTFYVGVTLMPSRDDDLIAELLATPRGQLSARVREMMRSGISTSRFLEGAENPVEVDMALASLEV